MGKRGPKPTGGYPEKSAVLSTRITRELRGELEKAAAASGRSLASEIEHRLRRSFSHEDEMRRVFGNDETSAVMRMIADVINMTVKQAGAFAKRARRKSSDSWLDDPYVFDQATKAAILIMEVFRPPGDASRPRMAEEESAPTFTSAIKAIGEGFTWGPGYALHLLRTVRDVKGDLPMPAQGEDEMTTLARGIADDLGPMVKRIAKEESK